MVHHGWGRSWGCWAGPQQRTEEERPASTAQQESLCHHNIPAELLSSGPCFLGKEYEDYLVIIRLKLLELRLWESVCGIIHSYSKPLPNSTRLIMLNVQGENFCISSFVFSIKPLLFTLLFTK